MDISTTQAIPRRPVRSTEKKDPTNVPSEPEKPHRWLAEDEKLTPFVLNWTCVVLTVAATIVFGIWAPLSYKATVDANNSGNAAQSSAMSIASAATELAASQSSVLEALQTRMAAIAQLQLLEFCLSFSTVDACTQFSEVLTFSNLASSLVSPTILGSDVATTSGITTATPAASSGGGNGSPKKENGSKLSFPVEAILGTVFGVIGLFGVGLGVFVWRYRKKRLGDGDRPGRGIIHE